MREKLVIIGNGMAPGRVLDELFDNGVDRYDITIFNAEARVNYDRIMLSPVLSGEKRFEDIIIHDDAWYAAHGITLYKGKPVMAIHRASKTVTAIDGSSVPYDKLLIATGSRPIIPPMPGHDLVGVVSYRDLDDVDAMLAAARRGGRAVVIGGGLLGLEAAAGLKERGMQVTVLHLAATLMERQLDSAAGHLLAQALRQRGIEVVTEANTRAVLGDSHVQAVELHDGRRFDADLVVFAIGIRPNTSLAAAADLDVARGIVVGDDLRTSDADIFAVGECVEHRGQCYGLVAPLYEMARVVASELAGHKAAYAGSQVSTKLKVTGIDVYSAGDFADGEGREEIVLRDAARHTYKRLTLADNRIVGVVLFGDTRDGAWFYQQMREARDVSDTRDTLIFGQHYAGGAALDPTAAVAALPDDAEICGCNGVCKGKIVKAIAGQGLKTLNDVRAHTKASSSCGSCTGLVEQLLKLQLGAAYSVDAVPAMCGCTRLGHDQVRRLILAKELKSIPDVMQSLEWTTSCGCAKCRPALNYYLLAAWPGEYQDDAQSRYINERAHANIQKDGTFSVVPRMWGGMTTPAELRAIADVAERFAIPAVKVTGGQRIDLLGVRKQDLPAVWAELNAAGMVSGHAYGKALRTVKTCVGTDWCRFGTQDSTGLGIRLEKTLWGAWTPHKVKLAVSGCPRNCAEATCKDFGVICVDSGYELHFAGAAGMHLKATEILCNVASEDEVVEYCAATLQLYREQGHYLERMYTWAARVGVATVRDTIVTRADLRAALVARFDKAQHYARHDPWAQRAHGRENGEFRPMARVARPRVSA
ncbi:MAG: NAD(P)/FAD-dependent oxidoreductase [Proteobacteria bacterium]|nr:NAD(P)/FAD-dependent oxidoreductase [Pseudomonadota bacterium]